MAVHVKTKRLTILATSVITLLILGGMAFVFCFMDAVYEGENLLPPGNIPSAVIESFERQFDDTDDVEWKFDDDLYEAAFPWRGAGEVEAYFRPDGTWVKSEFPIAFSALPDQARSYLESQEGYKIKDVERIQERESPDSYEVELGNKLMQFDCFFDDQGNLISKERDGPVLEPGPSGDE